VNFVNAHDFDLTYFDFDLTYFDFDLTYFDSLCKPRRIIKGIRKEL
jgi:hypothetical protein